ncbi:MAG: ATP-binding cassette domain-containing protein [Chloroflexi bacterium]|nr:ATP-binding cassette domain-containing protein [Chloroflexota bacterium]
MTDEPIISITKLEFTYTHGTRPALAGVSLQIGRGEYVGIVGLNGAGKTTLGLCLNGIIPHMLMGQGSGAVRIDGRDPWTTPVREMARTVGMVFDNPEFQMSQVTAGEEVALGLENVGLPYEEMVPRVAEALELVGLAGFDERSPMALSGGQQQRLAIASTLAMRPSILFMDEPTSNLDPIGKEEVFEIARRLNREAGMTIIVAEHEVEVLAEYADRIIVLDEGRIALQGTPSEVFGEVETMARLGLRVPQVAEFAHAVRGQSAAARRGPLPVTLAEAVAWVGDGQ